MNADEDVSQDPEYPEAVYLNFTSMHNISSIVLRIKELASQRLPKNKIPNISYFRKIADVLNPIDDLPCIELPFSVYLITGNAGSGKSTCLQTLSETMDCVMTGTTKVASQNIYAKLSSSYVSPHINTIFQEFGFKGHHVQATLGKWHYTFKSNPPSLPELQKRDLVYYWEIISDITKTKLKATEDDAAAQKFLSVKATEDALGLQRGTLAKCAFYAHGGLPAFTRTNIIVIDEAGLLGKYILTAVTYCWWLFNAAYQTPQYEAGLCPVIVCVGSPTQTSSLESIFEHDRMKCNIRTSENILTFLICNRVMRDYLNLSKNWAIFINNKRCTEEEFGDLLKCLEYGLPMTESHARIVDNFVVPEAFINNPANLPGWTRLYSSHKEVSSYMSRLHTHLKLSGDNKFTVFTMPSYTLVKLADFEQYRELTNQPSLTLDRWLNANSGRLSNWSQSRDQDTVHSRCEVRSDIGLAIACSEVTYVLNSQVSVTTRLKKWMFGFCGTFHDFMFVLKDDSFIKNHADVAVEYAYRFLSHILFNGMISFYDFLLNPKLCHKSVEQAYSRLSDITRKIVPVIDGYSEQTETELSTLLTIDQVIDLEQDDSMEHTNAESDMYAFNQPNNDDDVIFAALNDKTVDLLYCNYDLGNPETPSAVHAQFAMLKTLFLARYAVLFDIFGNAFSNHRFDSYVENVTFKAGEMFAANLRGGMLSLALQTDNYTLVGHTKVKVHALSEPGSRKRIGESTADALQDLQMSSMVLKDQHGFMSIININVNDFVETIEDKELKLAVTADYGLSSKLAMTIARSQGLSLEKVAICFPKNGIKLNNVYVAMSRVVSSEYLRMNINPLREQYTRDNTISAHILAALRDPDVQIVY